MRRLEFPVPSLTDLIDELTPVKGQHSIDKFAIEEVSKLVQTLKFHHDGTFQHSLNASRLATWLARKLGLSQAEVMEISIGALLHDFGKTKVDATVLDKPSSLTTEEWRQIRKHPRDGVAMLSAYPWADNLHPMVAYHHERLDGRGYIGLAGDTIPLSAKIVCIADAFDAMISPRPYQTSRTLTQCWEELERNSGTQFDKDLVAPFISVTGRIITT